MEYSQDSFFKNLILNSKMINFFIVLVFFVGVISAFGVYNSGQKSFLPEKNEERASISQKIAEEDLMKERKGVIYFPGIIGSIITLLALGTLLLLSVKKRSFLISNSHKKLSENVINLEENGNEEIKELVNTKSLLLTKLSNMSKATCE